MRSRRFSINASFRRGCNISWNGRDGIGLATIRGSQRNSSTKTTLATISRIMNTGPSSRICAHKSQKLMSKSASWLSSKESESTSERWDCNNNRCLWKTTCSKSRIGNNKGGLSFHLCQMILIPSKYKTQKRITQNPNPKKKRKSRYSHSNGILQALTQTMPQQSPQLHLTKIQFQPLATRVKWSPFSKNNRELTGRNTYSYLAER